MKNLFKILFGSPKKKTAPRVRNSNGMYARKVKIGGMYTGHIYMESSKGFRAVGR